MRRDLALSILRSHLPELIRLGVRSLSLFGSVARDQATEGSDVDVLVDLAQPMGLFSFIGFQQRLEELHGRPVDLVPLDGIRPRLREVILAEALPVAV